VSYWADIFTDFAGVHKEESPYINEARSIWIEYDPLPPVLRFNTCFTAAYTNINCDAKGLVQKDYVCDDVEDNCPDGVEETKESADLNFIDGQIKSIKVKDKTRVTVSSNPRFIPGAGDFTHVFENHYPVYDPNADPSLDDDNFTNCLCINLQKMNGNTVEEYHSI
jgi:hypothetical protein